MISKLSRSSVGQIVPAIEEPGDGQSLSVNDSIKAVDLLGGRRTLRIKHQGAEYVLRITRNEKLILTK
ncbi:hemin uptake protein HemP [Granulosicoccus antarcticus]|uniref:hemin uptake protein HemP n=1 Tax=Granulosicoccus antarcticus TaxID=437505 RepID=UPI001F1FD79D|nr:hemin uptake protein HemP [Granulosicoccus antarcticus]